MGVPTLNEIELSATKVCTKLASLYAGMIFAKTVYSDRKNGSLLKYENFFQGCRENILRSVILKNVVQKICSSKYLQLKE